MKIIKSNTILNFIDDCFISPLMFFSTVCIVLASLMYIANIDMFYIKIMIIFILCVAVYTMYQEVSESIKADEDALESDRQAEEYYKMRHGE
jgi:hypothetical protein